MNRSQEMSKLVGGTRRSGVPFPCRRWMTLVACALAVGILVGGAAETARCETKPAKAGESGAESSRASAHWIRINLPLVGERDTEIKATIDKLLDQLPAKGERPVMIFEFHRDAQAGGTTAFERGLSLARYLVGARLSRVRTVAFVPNTIDGHAVLPVLACEEIIMSVDAQLGAAGRNESTIDDTMRAAYREIAGRRRTIPEPFVLGMLDAKETVTEVQLVGGGGVRYVLTKELETFRTTGQVLKETSITPSGDLGQFTGRALRVKYGYVSYLAEDRKQVAEALKLAPGSIVDERERSEWRAIRVAITGRLSSRSAGALIHSIDQGIAEGANLVLLSIDSPGGTPASSVQLAGYLADLEERKIRTVAHIGGQALSTAVLVAAACDEAYAADAARLGGPGDTFLTRADLEDLAEAVREIATRKGRDWSLLLGLLDSELTVAEFTHKETGAKRYFCGEERDEQGDANVWKEQAAIDLSDGITGVQARHFQLIRDLARDLETVVARFHIAEEIAVAQPNQMISSLERLAAQPWFARILLMIAFFALMSEMSAPGLGAPGFVSVVCFLLFFWSQFLNGTAGWLELMLFLGGIACIGLEIFVIPGFGVFGIGGGAMVLTSLVLASQTFIIPRNSYQLEQLPQSLMSIVFVAGGILTALWFMRNVLPEAPFFRRLTLPPAMPEELQDELESLVDWRYLSGKRGVTTTQLTPSGKARFGDEVINVISDGELVYKGSAIRVVKVIGNRVVVEAIEDKSDAAV